MLNFRLKNLPFKQKAQFALQILPFLYFGLILLMAWLAWSGMITEDYSTYQIKLTSLVLTLPVMLIICSVGLGYWAYHQGLNRISLSATTSPLLFFSLWLLMTVPVSILFEIFGDITNWLFALPFLIHSYYLWHLYQKLTSAKDDTQPFRMKGPL